jgi:Uncharacterized protein conserved in bacteria N-term (DUF3322)
VTSWTAAADLRATLERRWRSGAILKGYAEGVPFVPISLPISRPRDVDLLERRDEVNAWLRRLNAECAATARRPGLRIETASVPSRQAATSCLVGSGSTPTKRSSAGSG